MDSLILPETDVFDQFFSENCNAYYYNDDSSVQIFLPTYPDEPFVQHQTPMVKQEQESAPATAHQSFQAAPQHSTITQSFSRQSRLHNCPKHLVKFLAQALDLTHLDRLNYEEVFPRMSNGGRVAIKGLLEILLGSHKGKIKSTSKELLKIVFETGSERNRKFKLLNNIRIRNYFENHDPMSVMEAKACLRDYAIEKLLLKKNSCIDESRIIRKDINERYVEIFIKELQEGVIRERISKSDKLKIFETCENF